MRFHKIVLQNIRSYTHQELVFPDGVVLLSGDIGSGKSTILLAIEFALFGLLKGELNGAALLRHGAENGSVTLTLSVDGKDMTIHRTLKRGLSVTQDAGYTIIDGKKEAGSAVELKERVLSLLQYPPELLSKSKSLVYRYTVYTPQEDMKQILLSEQEARLETLRKVFGIDKYKVIRDNAARFLAKLRERTREFAGRIADLPAKEEELRQYREQLQRTQHEHNKLATMITTCTAQVDQQQKTVATLEAQAQLSRDLQHQQTLHTTTMANVQRQIETLQENLQTMEKDLERITKERPAAVSVTSDQLEVHHQQLVATEAALRSLVENISQLKAHRAASEEIATKITSLEKCPTCEQHVTPEHRKSVLEREERKRAQLIADLRTAEQSCADLDHRLVALKKQVEEVQQQTHQQQLRMIHEQRLKELQARKMTVHETLQALRTQLDQSRKTLEQVQRDLSTFTDIQNQFSAAKKLLDDARKQLRDVEVQQARLQSTLQSLQEHQTRLQREQEEKRAVKQKLERLLSLRTWIEEQFIPLTEVMERKVLLKVHRDFDQLFQKWFGLLVDSDVLTIRLGEDFSPVIVQNGYETAYENLSGGEKTAAALAYRLALNHVINALLSVIKTRDVLILDEPTDGFSSEQLDRLRLVFEELKIAQILLVSHESKLEGYASTVLRIEKENHLSRISGA